MADIKHSISKTMESVKNKINLNNRKGCFELFGYDFMVDQDLTVWLIECNTNPCLTETCPLLRKLIPRMIDDTFRLTIDKEFTSPAQDKIDMLNEMIKNNYVKCPDHLSKRIINGRKQP
jgi:hypothetical protein